GPSCHHHHGHSDRPPCKDRGASSPLLRPFACSSRPPPVPTTEPPPPRRPPRRTPSPTGSTATRLPGTRCERTGLTNCTAIRTTFRIRTTVERACPWTRPTPCPTNCRRTSPIWPTSEH